MISERLRAKREEFKPSGGRAMLSPPAINFEAADTIDTLVAALEEEVARTKDSGLWPNPKALAALALARGGK